MLAIQEEVSRSIVTGLLNSLGTAESPTVRVSSSMPLQEISPPRCGPKPSGVNLLVTKVSRSSPPTTHVPPLQSFVQQAPTRAAKLSGHV